MSTEVVAPSDKPKLIDFSVNARARYEYREAGALEASHAGTLRVRPGITFLPEGPFTLFVESEHTLALIDDYQVGTPQSAILDPFTANNTPIGDPETNELNQAYAQFKKDDFKIKVGRQRYILDNAAFIGNVGWRQNEQTLDAVSIANKYGAYSFSYAYANKVNRIFGSDALGAVRALEGDVHLFNNSYKFESFTLGGYLYHMDFDEVSFAFASNSTYGVYADFDLGPGKVHAEYAYQTDATDGQLGYSASYAHVKYGQKVGSYSVHAGVEYLEDGFVTPLATVHAYNGFADNFIGNRLGLVNSWEGLTDFYAGASTKISDVALKGFVHYYADDSLNEDYGWELDFVAAKPIAKNTKLVAKLAYYNGGFTSDDEIKQASVQIDYSF